MGKKRYKKDWGKLFQVRMSKEEYDELLEFIKKFKVTRREFLTTVVNELSECQIIRKGQFWSSKQSYAYSIGDYGKDRKESCELCNDEYRYRNSDTQIIGHHYLGYDDENINNVKWLCRRCHGFVHRKEHKDKNWDRVIEAHSKWNGNSRYDEEMEELNKNINI